MLQLLYTLDCMLYVRYFETDAAIGEELLLVRVPSYLHPYERNCIRLDQKDTGMCLGYIQYYYSQVLAPLMDRWEYENGRITFRATNEDECNINHHPICIKVWWSPGQAN